MFKYKIDVLAELKKAGYNQPYMIEKAILPSTTLTALRCGRTNLSLATLGKICQLLKLQPGDIIEWVEE